MSKRNDLDWFHDNHCSYCDRPGKGCEEGSMTELACIAAAILRELVAIRKKGGESGE